MASTFTDASVASGGADPGSTAALSAARYVTYHDLTEHVLATASEEASGRSVKAVRRAVRDAYVDLLKCHNWTRLRRRALLTTNGPYSTGNLSFDLTGGASERLVTLSGGTWPSWAGKGVLIVGTVRYLVDARQGDTLLTLKANSAPAEDVAAGTEYTLVRDTYDLPSDFTRTNRIRNASTLDWLDYVTPSEFGGLADSQETMGTPRAWTVIGDQNVSGKDVLLFYPPPSTEQTFDFIYPALPAAPRLHEHTTGTVSVTADSASVSGVGTNWSQKMVGAVLRFGTATAVPGGPDADDDEQFVEEGVVKSVESTASLTLEEAALNTLAAVKYRISSRLDVAPWMESALRAGAELQFARMMREDGKVIAAAGAAYAQYLVEAKEADGRTVPDVAAPRDLDDRDLVRMGGNY